MDTFFADLRYGLKLLVKDKAFTLTAILTLGLAIGANTAIFSVVDSVILEPLSFEEPEQLVTIFNSYPNAGAERASNGVPDYFDRRKAIDAFAESALSRTGRRTLGTEGAPQQVVGMRITPTLFDVLRVQPAIGRGFTTEEGEEGNGQVVILSHASHQELFGGEAAAVGKDLKIDGQNHTIVGVMGEDFLFENPEVRIWTPDTFSVEQRSDQSRHSNSWDMIARLAPGATLGQAQQQIDALNAANMDRFPNFKNLLIDAGFHTQVHPYLDDMIREIRPTLFLLWGGVAFVLLIACVNLANLILVRSNARLKEMSTRLALGAGRGQVTRQLLIENLTLCLMGGVLGIGLGRLGLVALNRLGMDELPRGAEITMDGGAMLFTLAMATVIGLVLGMIPLLRMFRLNLNAVLREETRGGTGSRATRMVGRALVVSQVAFAFVLLCSAGLLLSSFRNVLSADPGYDTEGVLTASISMPEARYPEPVDRWAFVDRAVERIRTLPGVKLAGATDTLPLSGSYSDSVIFPEGYQARPGESVVSPNRMYIGPDYLEALGVDLIQGRTFDSRDTAESQIVALVDERMADHFWGTTDVLGKRLFFPNNTDDLTNPGDDPEWITVVGVVGSIKLKDLEDGNNKFGAYYLSMAQQPRGFVSFAIRTDTPGTALLPSLRGLFQELDPEMPIFNARTMEQRVELSTLTRRSPMLLALVFGGVALFLAAVGIYGVLAYLVARRTRELGIRMALGSSTGSIFSLVLKEGLLVVSIGLGLGILGAAALAKVLAGQLYGIGAMDPGVILGVIFVMASVAFAACAIPGLRAASIDPAVALHD